MDHTDYPYFTDNWLKSQRSKQAISSKNFIGDRPYRHFDARVTRADIESNISKVAPMLRDPHVLSKHSFLPFIRKDKKVRRFSKRKEISQKIRPIMYASHQDACIYGFYSYLLKLSYEAKIKGTPLEDSVLAYRHIKRADGSGRGKSNIDFAKDVQQLTASHDQCAILCLDIEKFFDRMDHTLIKEKWKALLGTDELPIGHYTVYKNITNFRYVFLYEALVKLGYGRLKKGRFIYKKNKRTQGPLCSPHDFNTIIAPKIGSLVHKNKTNKGIPQGSPISDIIANMYLQGFDEAILEKLESLEFGRYRRYSDDIFIICPVNKAKEIYDYTLNCISKDKVSIKPSKTEALTINNTDGLVADITFKITRLKPHRDSHRQAFQYLGFEIDTQDMNIRSGTLANHYRRAKRKAKAIAKTAAKKSSPPATTKPKRKNKRQNRSRWRYFISAKRRTQSSRIGRQFKKALKRVGSFSKDQK